MKTDQSASVKALLAESRCALSLKRSANGFIRIEMRTHTLGSIELTMGETEFTDLIFGVCETDAAISRITPRKPSYPAPAA